MRSTPDLQSRFRVRRRGFGRAIYMGEISTRFGFLLLTLRLLSNVRPPYNVVEGSSGKWLFKKGLSPSGRWLFKKGLSPSGRWLFKKGLSPSGRWLFKGGFKSEWKVAV